MRQLNKHDYIFISAICFFVGYVIVDLALLGLGRPTLAVSDPPAVTPAGSP